MGLGDVVAKKILTQLIIKGALGCTTPTLTKTYHLSSMYPHFLENEASRLGSTFAITQVSIFRVDPERRF